MGFQDGHTPLQKEIDRQVRQRVLDGIELLKKQYGPDFADHIDMKKFNIRNGESCVLGQLFGAEGAVHGVSGYSYALERPELFGLHEEHPDRWRTWSDELYGFNTVSEDEERLGPTETWDQLQAAWEEELNALKK